MRQLLEILWSAVSGWIPMPEWRMEVAPWVFWPMFIVLIALGAYAAFHEFRKTHREAVAQGQGKTNLWVPIIMTIGIGGIGYWFIRS